MHHARTIDSAVHGEFNILSVVRDRGNSMYESNATGLMRAMLLA